MMAVQRILVVCLLACLCFAQGYCEVDSYEQSLRDALAYINSNATLQAAMADHLKLFNDGQEPMQSEGNIPGPKCSTCGYEWPCEINKPTSAATSVHNLKPSDVNVVGAIGDSITAGNGIAAWTILGCLTNYRGLSWSVGGEGDLSSQFTLPNIIKKYNPDVKGYATGNGKYTSNNAGLNYAVAGAKSDDMVTQAIRLTEEMKVKTDFQNDWKIITLFIGGNDLCAACKEPAYYKAKYYTDRIRNALDILHAEVPRAFINVVPILDGTFVDELNKGLICSVMHWFVCKCGAYPENEDAKKKTQALVREYQDSLTNLIESGRYDTRDDFTVVIQPFFKYTKLPKKSDGQPDLSYFAPDCFHFSRKGHRNAAEALWNNMIEPVGSKRTNWVPHEEVECPPNNRPFFATYKNSKESPKQSVNSVLGSIADDKHPKNTAAYTNMIVGSMCGVVAAIALVGILLFVRQRKRSRPEKDALIGERNVAYS